MIDFEPWRRGNVSLQALVDDLTADDLGILTNDMIETMLAMIAPATDADVTYVPDDPDADDPFAADASERHMPWTLGHVIVHVTASAEESAALAAELARGVAFHGRSRHEVDWRTMRTVDDCIARLEESRRMRLATLDMWPAKPHLTNTYVAWEPLGPIGPAERFVLGLAHDADHLDQIEQILRQARADRDRRHGGQR